MAVRAARLCLLALLLAACAAAPPAPTNDAVREPVEGTPNCPQPRYADRAALLAALPGASDPCAEELAAVLALTADPALLDALIAQAQQDASGRGRRNALRALGRLAEQPPQSAAAMAFTQRQAALRDTLTARLSQDSDPDTLADLVWLLDTALYPVVESQPALTALALDQRQPTELRDRAAAAVGRLIFARTGPLTPADLGFITDGLRGPDANVRARAARTVRYLRPEQTTPEQSAALTQKLSAIWPAAQTAALDTAGPASALVAAAEIARALDARSGGDRAAQLQQEIERSDLPQTYTDTWLDIRAALPAAQLPALATLLAQTRAAYADLVGESSAAPLLGDPNPRVKILVFPAIDRYRGYLAAFVNVPFAVDGVYREDRATIYTYVRTPAQSTNTLPETLRHELTHYLAGRSVFPGSWETPGYHDQPKGWADEGLAELLAGAEFTASGYTLPLRHRLLAELCGRAALPPLQPLLERRAGYDRFGSFDYAAAWSLVHFLFTAHPAGARAIYAAYRSGTYRTADAAALAGFSSPNALETAWHAALRAACAAPR